jgi:hypothetical protein
MFEEGWRIYMEGVGWPGSCTRFIWVIWYKARQRKYYAPCQSCTHPDWWLINGGPATQKMAVIRNKVSVQDWCSLTMQTFQFPVISQRSILGVFLRCGRLFCHLIVVPNWVMLHFEPENVNFRTSSVNSWYLGVDLSVLRCKKRGGLSYSPNFFFFTGVACWKLKGLPCN